MTGREWFWDVKYPGKNVRTANEIHIPVGASVLVRVTSDDVIHSLWVPALNRKIDAIPGRTNAEIFVRERKREVAQPRKASARPARAKQPAQPRTGLWLAHSKPRSAL